MVSTLVSAMPRPRGVWQKLADLRKRAKPLGLAAQYLGRLRHISGTPTSDISDSPRGVIEPIAIPATR